MRRSQAPSVISKRSAAKSAVASLKREATMIAKRNMITPIVKKVLRSEQEKKYYEEGYTVQVGAEGASLGASGHALTFLNFPAAGDGVSNRTGNKIQVVQFSVKFTATQTTLGSTNQGARIKMILICNKDGGNFNADHFYDIDLSSGTRLTWRSMRNIQYFSSFKVLAERDVTFEADSYQSNGQIASGEAHVKCDIPVRFNSGSTTALQNSFAIMFVADNGSIVGGTGYTMFVNSRFMYTDE